ncbi:helix-turn-helix transcriptional regulator [Balneatrix alpica]|uniref:helix-turn-helix transcriptional regulator n=1 Tax=Balneatrix alpica TaxID=75684 RepID=UPI002739B34A|nr:metalloregulator ArsR/SmtB family transcription factor [Balneatrix alpica]
MLAMETQTSTDKILFLLKTQGPQSAAELAERLQMTAMGARQHLQQLEQDGWLESYSEARGRGRPNRLWQLSEKAWSRFPDAHAELMVVMLDSVQQLFGKAGLEQLISKREADSLALYQTKMQEHTSLADKLQVLMELRCREGYMADLQPQSDGSWLLLEHHCPICSAARQCQGFCRSELAIFQQLLAPAQVERTQHLLGGGQRCVYRIVPSAEL